MKGSMKNIFGTSVSSSTTWPDNALLTSRDLYENSGRYRNVKMYSEMGIDIIFITILALLS